MSETAESKFPRPKASSYQTLLEGGCEVIVRAEADEGQQINISELLRDLYTKHYALARTTDAFRKRLESLEAPTPTPST